MITEDHLNHWIGEIKWQLNGILSEIKAEKVILNGINVGKYGEAFVSFEYLREKADTIAGILKSLEFDISHDALGTEDGP